MTDTPPPSPTDDELVEMIAATLDPVAWGEEANLAYRIAQGLGAPTQDTVYEWTPRREAARKTARTILSRIRPLLEARGIEIAATFVEFCNCGSEAEAAKDLRSIARRHAEGGK